MEPALQTMINNMPEKTGKSLEEWKKLLKSKSFAKHGEALNFLKKEHGLTHGFANTIVSLSRDAQEDPADLVELQYSGKETLRPIYDSLIKWLPKVGSDISIIPKKATVSIKRNRQFLLIKPATKTRIDLGLKFNKRPVGERLENSGPFGSMCSHRVKISSLDELDEELKCWIREAYEEAG